MNGLLKEGQSDKLHYYVFDNREHAGEMAACDIAAAILECLKDKDEINMIFAAAPSQNETLARLIEYREIPWERINAFHMDEYIGLPYDALQGFGNFLKKAIFEKVPFKSVNYINGFAADTKIECERYAELLQKHKIDIVCLGIGENGHIAFNDPGVADFDDPEVIKRVSLDEICRNQQVNDGCFSSLEDVPKYALTLTIPTLVKAKHMFCTVPSVTKKNAVTETVCGEVSESCPASILRKHPHAVLYADIQSGSGIL